MSNTKATAATDITSPPSSASTDDKSSGKADEKDGKLGELGGKAFTDEKTGEKKALVPDVKGPVVSRWAGFCLPFRPVSGQHYAWLSVSSDASSDVSSGSSGGGVCLPVVEVGEMAGILTSDDVRAHQRRLESKLISPTGCEFVSAAESKLQPNVPPHLDTFYRDQHNHTAWAYNRLDGGVYAYVPTPSATINRPDGSARLYAPVSTPSAVGSSAGVVEFHCVATSVPEFLARLLMECEISWAADLGATGDEARQLFRVMLDGPGMDALRTVGQRRPEQMPSSTTVAQVLLVELRHLWNHVVPKYFSPAQIRYLEPFYQSYYNRQKTRLLAAITTSTPKGPPKDAVPPNAHNQVRQEDIIPSLPEAAARGKVRHDQLFGLPVRLVLAVSSLVALTVFGIQRYYR